MSYKFKHPEELAKNPVFECLNFIQNELSVRKPYPSIKTVFYNHNPINRNNLKKCNLKNRNKIKVNKKKQKYNAPTIESIINNSKDSEFLNSDSQNKYYSQKIVIPVKMNSHQTSSSALYIKQKQNSSSKIMHMNNTNNINKIFNNSKNKVINSQIIEEPALKTKKISKVIDNTDTNLNKEINLNDLYKEYIENVSIII